jgi:serine/threonine protein kinase
MSYCLNPSCSRPQNPPQSNFCRSCGGRLRLRDRYLAIQPIGQGGFGRTFKAIDEDKPSKPFCVIKQFFPQTEDVATAKKAAELFTQEASALEQLDNSNIPELLAYFITPDGRKYLVQEFIDGQNLKAELVANGVFSAERVRELLLTMLPILDYIHRLGFIHRDIKPENIIRRTDNRRLYLVDFGAAKITDREQQQAPGTTIGTPEFMAPEQSWGRAFPSSDLYSLGVTCINLLTGLSSFELFDDNLGEWVWRGAVTQEIDSQLVSILDKLIQTKPVDRFQTAQATLAVLSDNSIEQNTISTVTIDPEVSSIETTLIVQSQPIPIVRSCVCIHTFKWHTKPINAIDIFSDGQYLISGDDGGTVAVWNLSMPQQPMATYRTNNSIWAVAASPDLSHMASGDKDRKIYLSKKESIGNSRHELHGSASSLDSHSGFIRALRFSPDGKILASGANDRKIRLWDTATSKIIYTLDGHEDAVTALQFMSKGKILVSAGNDLTIRFWDLDRKQLFKTIVAHDREINTLAIGLDEQIILTGSSDLTIHLRQLKTGIQHILSEHEAAVMTVAISPDGKTIASGAIDGKIDLWDTDTQHLAGSFSAHQGAVKSIVFHPFANTFISASEDCTISMWQYS